MEPPAKTQPNARLTWFTVLLVVWAAALLAQIVNLQVLHHEEYAKAARQQQERMVEIRSPRGDIFDRNGQTMAMSVTVDTVYVNPMRAPDGAVVADVIAPVLEIDRNQLTARIRQAKEDNQGFLRIKRRISRVESERLRSLNLDWIEFEQESQRHYPRNSTGAHVLGSVDHEEKGEGGIERSLDAELRGQPGRARMLTDVKRRGFEMRVAQEPKPGTSLVLSIDERIQHAAERYLKEAVDACRAQNPECETGSVVVMNPQTGEMLAVASYPPFDPNTRPKNGREQKARENVAVSYPFEPGSVFKVFSLATGLEAGRLRPESMMPCGRIVLAGRVVHEAKHFFGPLSLTHILEQSSNAGAAQVGLRVGKEKMNEYIRRLGFGQKTGLPLPSESPGLLRRVEKWDPDSVGFISFGHEIAATTVQLASAASVIANGGIRVKPRLLLKKRYADGREEAVPAERPVRVLEPETANRMRRMMEGVVLEGTGKGAKLAGYTSGGKTGSAQIFNYEERRYTHNYNASFLGFAPVINPAIVVGVTINGSRVYGGTIAAPVFKKVTEEALRVLDVPKDLPETAPKEEPEPETLIAEDGPVAHAAAQASEPAPVIADPNACTACAGPRVPDFSGKSVREVVEISTRLGMPVALDGSGIARLQAPPPGAVLRPGGRIKVRFGR